MVYIAGGQTARYPKIPQGEFTTTKQHFHDDPSGKEPIKHSTFAKLYDNSVYFMSKRLEKQPTKSHDQTFKMGESESKLTWSGRLPAASYTGNGTFQLANSLTYSYKPVKLVPYSELTRTEYQASYNKKAPYKGYSILSRARDTPRWS